VFAFYGSFFASVRKEEKENKANEQLFEGSYFQTWYVFSPDMLAPAQ